MGIAEPEGPDLLTCAGGRAKRIVIGNAIAAVAADRACGRVLGDVGDDAENLPDQRVESLRIVARVGARRFSRGSVTAAEIEDTPLRASALSRWIKGEVGDQVGAGVELHAEHSRAVPSNVAFARFESVHSTSTPSRVMGPGVASGAVTE